MKRIVKFTVVLLALCLALTACQPTPEEEFVVQRDAVVIEEKINATPSIPAITPSEEEEAEDNTPSVDLTEWCEAQVKTYKATLPEHWSDYIETAYIKMSIEADVVVPIENGFPVYKVKKGKFSSEKMNAIISSIMPNITGVREGTTALPEEYAAAIASLNDRGMSEYAKFMFKKQQEAEEGSYIETSSIPFTSKEYQAYIVRQQDGTIGKISLLGNILIVDTHFNSMVHLKDLVEMDGSYEGEGKVILNPSITQEQAEEKLDVFLLENELEGFTIEKVSAARHFTFMTREEISQGWQFELVRSYGYYPMDTFHAANAGGWFHLPKEESYSAAWETESIYVYVSEAGVEHIQWNYPLEVVECVNPCVEIMEFEEIQQKLKNLLTAGVSWREESTYQPRVSKLVLAASLQQVKDEPGYAYVMPVWVAIVDWYYDGVYADESDYVCTQVVGVNAIDGSRAELNWEY